MASTPTTQSASVRATRPALAKDWGTPEQETQLVFASRRGLLPAARALIDHLVLHIPGALGR